MQIRKARHQESTLPIDTPSVLGNSHTSDWANGHDSSAAGNNGPVRQKAVRIHRDDGDVDESDWSRIILGLGINGPQQGED